MITRISELKKNGMLWKNLQYPRALHSGQGNGICFLSSQLHVNIDWKNDLGLPWWCSGWESACQCRGHRFEPWSGKVPHAADQLGPWATITEPARLEPVLRNKRGRDSERPAHRDEEWPRSPQLEKALAQKRRPNTTKKIKKYKNKFKKKRMI